MSLKQDLYDESSRSPTLTPINVISRVASQHLPSLQEEEHNRRLERGLSVINFHQHYVVS